MVCVHRASTSFRTSHDNTINAFQGAGPDLREPQTPAERGVGWEGEGRAPLSSLIFTNKHFFPSLSNKTLMRSQTKGAAPCMPGGVEATRRDEV